MDKNPNLALTTAGIVFLVVALLHLSRLILKFEVAINGQHVRLMWNAVGFAVASGLSVWLFKSRV